MNAKDFRRIALSFEGAEESSHMGQPDFRVGGRIFATLASQHMGYGNLMLTLEQQEAFLPDLSDVFLPIAGGWGRMGMTHIRLAAANEEVLRGALHTAWKLRAEKNAKSGKKSLTAKKVQGAKEEEVTGVGHTQKGGQKIEGARAFRFLRPRSIAPRSF
jgi:hypothetical protein